jgi:hypothetical protein
MHRRHLRREHSLFLLRRDAANDRFAPPWHALKTESTVANSSREPRSWGGRVDDRLLQGCSHGGAAGKIGKIDAVGAGTAVDQRCE